MNPEENSTYSVIVSGVKGVGKRSLINAITENKRTSTNVPVITFSHPQTEKDFTLFFMANNLIGKGVHSNASYDEKPRWETEDKTIQSYCLRDLDKHDGLNIYLYDISNSHSFKALKEQLEKSKLINHGFTYLIGNKVDKQMQSRQVEYEEAKAFADSCGMAFSEISVATKKNLPMVTKMIKNGVFQFSKGTKKAPPELPPRDSEFDQISDSVYSASNESEYEKKLVEKMYKNNKSVEELESSQIVNFADADQESNKLRTGNFGDNFVNQNTESKKSPNEK